MQDGNQIDESASIEESVTLGDKLRICAHVYIGEKTVVGDKVTIREGAIIQENVCIGAYVFIDAGATICAGAILEKGARIGPNATVLPARHIGHNAVLMAGSVAAYDINPHVMASGVHARFFGFACICGICIWQPNSNSRLVFPLVCPKCGLALDIDR